MSMSHVSHPKENNATRQLSHVLSHATNTRQCLCVECRIDGVRFPPPRFHDCEYVRKRSRPIPQAERIANERAVIRPASEGKGESAQRWTRVFATAMDALSAPLLNGASDFKSADN
jgi:hypothetical protein